MRKWFGMLLMSMLLMAGCMQVSAAETGVLALGANRQIHRKQKSTPRWGSQQNRLLLIRQSI